jgi:cytidyltransferase-like protein
MTPRPSFVPDPPVVIFVPGVFDLLHAGHLTLLHRARVLADVGARGILVVGVVSDQGTAAYKGRLPAQNELYRLEAIARLPFVDVVELQETTDPTPLLERFRPHALVHGDDWARLRVGHATLERLGIEFVRLPYTPGISTTLLREAAS